MAGHYPYWLRLSPKTAARSSAAWRKTAGIRGPGIARDDDRHNRHPRNAPPEPIDGVGNNVANPTWGAADTDFARIAAAISPTASPRPTASRCPARVISNLIANQDMDGVEQDRTTMPAACPTSSMPGANSSTTTST